VCNVQGGLKSNNLLVFEFFVLLDAIHMKFSLTRVLFYQSLNNVIRRPPMYTSGFYAKKLISLPGIFDPWDIYLRVIMNGEQRWRLLGLVTKVFFYETPNKPCSCWPYIWTRVSSSYSESRPRPMQVLVWMYLIFAKKLGKFCFATLTLIVG